MRLDRDLALNGDDTEELGGGFALLHRDARTPIIVATGLAGTGALGFASPVDVDARLDAGALAWLGETEMLGGRRLCSLGQVHSPTCAAADTAHPVSDVLANIQDVDAVWTRSPDDLLIIRTADCAAVWLVDPEHGQLAMLHAGWRGTADGIVEHTIDALRAQRADPAGMVAAIGPHIGPCCFEVGPEIAAHFDDIEGAVQPASVLTAPCQRADSVSLNLAAVLSAKLQDAGFPLGAINVATACTRCFRSSGGDPPLHSYRRNGQGGPLMGSIGFLQR